MLPSPAAFVIGIAILIIVVWDAFEVIILPRRVTRRFRLSRFFYNSLWTVWRFCADLIPGRKVRESAFRSTNAESTLPASIFTSPSPDPC